MFFGLYFFLRQRNIQYIGKTEDVYTRLGQHINVKEFDDVMFLPRIPDSLQGRRSTTPRKSADRSISRS
ncbi:GIY-YIG nuclease family protein [Paraburkholderia graminis]|uniref:GIY-YIG nuclease family protein n=1 Tax=Paraburkholderia graminis TaxID=60548 RepID=UPI00352131BC